MALKDWKKYRINWYKKIADKNWNITIDRHFGNIPTDKTTNRSYFFYNVHIWAGDSRPGRGTFDHFFKNKSSALKFQKAYMRKH